MQHLLTKSIYQLHVSSIPERFKTHSYSFAIPNRVPSNPHGGRGLPHLTQLQHGFAMCGALQTLNPQAQIRSVSHSFRYAPIPEILGNSLQKCLHVLRGCEFWFAATQKASTWTFAPSCHFYNLKSGAACTLLIWCTRMVALLFCMLCKENSGFSMFHSTDYSLQLSCVGLQSKIDKKSKCMSLNAYIPIILLLASQ
jgi:hypothetical protein